MVIQVSKEALKDPNFLKVLVDVERAGQNSTVTYNALYQHLIVANRGVVQTSVTERMLESLQSHLQNPLLDDSKKQKVRKLMLNLMKNDPSFQGLQIYGSCVDSSCTTMERALAPETIRWALRQRTLVSLTNQLAQENLNGDPSKTAAITQTEKVIKSLDRKLAESEAPKTPKTEEDLLTETALALDELLTYTPEDVKTAASVIIGSSLFNQVGYLAQSYVDLNYFKNLNTQINHLTNAMTNLGLQHTPEFRALGSIWKINETIIKKEANAPSPTIDLVGLKTALSAASKTIGDWLNFAQQPLDAGKIATFTSGIDSIVEYLKNSIPAAAQSPILLQQLKNEFIGLLGALKSRFKDEALNKSLTDVIAKLESIIKAMPDIF